MNQIIFFEEIGDGDLNLVGGKGFNLGKIFQARLPVPNGFCISTAAYKTFWGDNKNSEIMAKLKTVNLENVSDISKQIRDNFVSKEMDQELENQIVAALAIFPASTRFAIRSSATAEDLKHASFAGQQDTYLNISGIDNIMYAIKSCWASLYTDRSILYRNQQNIAHDQVFMAVVVQQMINSDSAGIMFTADPVTGNRKYISIDAGFGLGESLASGTILPDIYKYNKKLSKIKSKHIAVKKTAVISDTHIGTTEVELDVNQSIMTVLDDNTIEQLALLGLKLEQMYDAPQDIEWCIDAGKIFILQTRSITSLFPVPTSTTSDLEVFLSLNHIQMMTNPISPLGQDSIRLLFRTEDIPLAEYNPRFLANAAGRLYINISPFLTHKLGQKILPAIITNVDANLGTAIKQLVQSKHDKIKSNLNLNPFKKQFKPVLFQSIKNFITQDTSNIVEKMDFLVEQQVVELNKLYSITGTHKDKLEFIYGQSIFLKSAIQNILSEVIPGIVAMKLLTKMEFKLLGSSMYISEISKGLEGNITTLLGLWIGDLADLVRANSHLIDLLSDTDYDSLFERVNNLGDDYTEFRTSFNNFMAKYGSRAAGEIDIAVTRWADNPKFIAKSILSLVETGISGEHRKNFLATVQHAHTMEKAFIEVIRMQHGSRKAKRATKLIKIFRDCMPLREHHKFLITHYLKHNRRLYLEIADAFVAAGRIDNREDIFYLGFWELYAAVQNEEVFQDLVATRKNEYEYFGRLKPPSLMTSDGEIITAKQNMEQFPKDALPGMAVSSGVVEGFARVITDPADAKVEVGEILVAPFTDPGWTILFINAAGLVMEIGGLLTHGTVVAREYGLPAVVGVEDATTLIKTGQRIRVNADLGYVEILSQ